MIGFIDLETPNFRTIVILQMIRSLGFPIDIDATNKQERTMPVTIINGAQTLSAIFNTQRPTSLGPIGNCFICSC